ncbi:DUF4232 domain-containing protein [Streptomyces kaempferi]
MLPGCPGGVLREGARGQQGGQAPPLDRPERSDKKCNLYRYPLVRLGADARTTVPVIKGSDPTPGVPVTLAPGEEAYAALLVSGGARDEYEAKSITLSLQGRKLGSNAGKPIDVPMPAPTLYADDGQLVTYWTTASGFALDFIMSK